MMPFPFRFETVLRVREAERDRCRQALAEEQQRDALLSAERDRVTTERLAALDELRLAHQRKGLPVERELARRQYVDQLAAEITRLTKALNEASAMVALRRMELLESDTAVKALEKLAGRHSADCQRAEQASTDRDRDDIWHRGRVA
jgi:flagellar biosynthesis chaperone FliJ